MAGGGGACCLFLAARLKSESNAQGGMYVDEALLNPHINDPVRRSIAAWVGHSQRSTLFIDVQTDGLIAEFLEKQVIKRI